MSTSIIGYDDIIKYFTEPDRGSTEREKLLFEGEFKNRLPLLFADDVSADLKNLMLCLACRNQTYPGRVFNDALGFYQACRIIQTALKRKTQFAAKDSASEVLNKILIKNNINIVGGPDKIRPEVLFHIIAAINQHTLHNIIEREKIQREVIGRKLTNIETPTDQEWEEA